MMLIWCLILRNISIKCKQKLKKWGIKHLWSIIWMKDCLLHCSIPCSSQTHPNTSRGMDLSFAINFQTHQPFSPQSILMPHDSSPPTSCSNYCSDGLSACGITISLWCWFKICCLKLTHLTKTRVAIGLIYAFWIAKMFIPGKVGMPAS